jgi:hypothetical protein
MNLKNEINASKGKFFSILYKRADTTIHKYVCRIGVKKGVKGTGKPALSENHVTLFAVNRDGHRTFCLDNILECSLA